MAKNLKIKLVKSLRNAEQVAAYRGKTAAEIKG